MNGLARKKKSKLKWLWITLITIAILVVAGGIYLFTVYGSVKSTVNKDTHESVKAIDTEVTKEKVAKRDSLNVLLMGVDERAGDKGRSDTMIVMTLDADNSRAQMVSIPRDTLTEIVGKGVKDKINHAYAFGGSEMSVDTVEKFLDIDLDYYVRVNMEGLEDLVDAVDGITIHNNFEFTEGGRTFKEGEVTLNGKEALSYVRMRKNDPEGDVGRNERQRKVIQAVIDKGVNVKSVTRINKLIGILGKNVVTNLDFDEIQELYKNYKNVRRDISTYQITGENKVINDIWYLLVPDEEKTKTTEMIREYGG
ncbi:transcriptional regulator LytR [Sporosarcina sp. P20a]|uniref:LCP family glycopolymer transferase n=1 Tax=Sporosarcina sp. P20a TaxID=2048256 RepID=UPI000C172A04|nr:LCP family protein [Sporosarcina sp. P20a]PIC86120.1 transcriptional regulator LytR [Sporosarcina sp. P20a]